MILITGATGTVGSLLVDELLALGQPVRVFTRDAGRAVRWGQAVECARSSSSQPWRPATPN